VRDQTRILIRAVEGRDRNSPRPITFHPARCTSGGVWRPLPQLLHCRNRARCANYFRHRRMPSSRLTDSQCARARACVCRNKRLSAADGGLDDRARKQRYSHKAHARTHTHTHTHARKRYICPAVHLNFTGPMESERKKRKGKE